MSELSALGLQRHHTFQGRTLMVVHVTVVVRQELHDLPLLIDGQKVQQRGCILSEPGQGKKDCVSVSTASFPSRLSRKTRISTWIAPLFFYRLCSEFSTSKCFPES